MEANSEQGGDLSGKFRGRDGGETLKQLRGEKEN